MISLALVGKNIAHSKSPMIYRELVSEVSYTLLDYATALQIPSAKTLLEKYDGISITSPYKQFFNDQVNLVGAAKKLNAINCIRQKDGFLEGTNTDYSAILEILQKYQLRYGRLQICILGDGVMANVTIHALNELNISFEQFSRRMNSDFYTKDYSQTVAGQKKIIINTCSRDFVYSGPIKSDIIFWDFNYNFDQHLNDLSKKCQYVDGLEMLRIQAIYALQFWSIKK